MKKEYLYFGAVVAIAVYALYKLQRPAPGVVSSLVPVSTGSVAKAPDARDPARVAGFTALASFAQGQQKVEAQRDTLLAQIEAEKIRADAQKDVLSQALDVERLRQGVAERLGLARLDSSDRQKQLDADTQLEAIRLAGENANQGAVGSGILAALVAALRGAQGAQAQRSQGGAGVGQGSGGSAQPGALQRFLRSIPVPRVGPYTPPFNPGYSGYSLADPFQSGFFGVGPASGQVDYYPDNFFGNIPLEPWNYTFPPLPPDADFNFIGGFQEVPTVGGSGSNGSWWNWPTTGPADDNMPTDDWVW